MPSISSPGRSATPGSSKAAPDLWLIHADPSQVGDALLNLALNARDAMVNGGALTIATANASVDAQEAAGIGEIAAGEYVAVTVVDTGTGMAPEVIERATEPFFTTKSAAMGSGLGLSMVYGFARQSGGCLQIASKVGVGTTIRLYLPRASATAVVAIDGMAVAGAPDPRGTEAVLLVADNPTLRAVTEQHLAALGYRVTAAANGPAALALLGPEARFDLLLTDVVMPEGMSGYELADAARRGHPRLTVLLTTGYASETPVTGDDTPEYLPMLRKPYRLHELATAVRGVLDGQGADAGHDATIR